MGVCIHYMLQLGSKLGKYVINGLNGGKKALAAEVSHIECFNLINIKSHEKTILA
jgi:hypothetical protein